MKTFKVNPGAAQLYLEYAAGKHGEKPFAVDEELCNLLKKLEGRALDLVKTTRKRVILRLPLALITFRENHEITLISLAKTMATQVE
jgi:hypothetical protein